MSTQMMVFTKRKCERCKGLGWVEIDRPFCKECHAQFTWEQLEKPAWRLPCGHRFSDLIESCTCPECVGRGEIEEWMDVGELFRKCSEEQVEVIPEMASLAV